MIRTRVGYAGGDSPNPTYHNLGNHTECLELDFDPTVLPFEELLGHIWRAHNPFASPRSPHYRAVLFARDAEQRAQIKRSVEALRTNDARPLGTAIERFQAFHLAEDDHQKYVLRRHREFEARLRTIYPDLASFVDSTAAARLNGYLGGYGTTAELNADLPHLGLDADAQARLLALHKS